jgi:hypothetical protein
MGIISETAEGCQRYSARDTLANNGLFWRLLAPETAAFMIQQAA